MQCRTIEKLKYLLCLSAVPCRILIAVQFIVTQLFYFDSTDKYTMWTTLHAILTWSDDTDTRTPPDYNCWLKVDARVLSGKHNDKLKYEND